ncbi:hypothetical protein E3A20_23330, partial [Planctomyces bekefii]
LSLPANLGKQASTCPPAAKSAIDMLQGSHDLPKISDSTPIAAATIVLSSVPAGIVGLLFKDQLEALFQNALAAGICLLETAIILLTARRLRGVGRGLTELSPAAALTIGVFQAVAILPGISRASFSQSFACIRDEYVLSCF